MSDLKAIEPKVATRRHRPPPSVDLIRGATGSTTPVESRRVLAERW